ncbi:unnamed protein product [Caenorhabditis sp. 36 PRJEB53466]|nr:unnamed protein product [Caenorhabditis sp. 36 PRJEB53466]
MSAKTMYYTESNEHFALVFASFASIIVILIFALRAQRKRIYEDNLFKQRMLLGQLFDMYMVRYEMLKIRLKQLEDHRRVLKEGREPDQE